MSLRNPDPRFSQSLERGLAILSCFTAQRSVLGISDLADRLDLSRSTVHRYAVTLTELGYLDQGENRKYRLGLRVIDLGFSAVSGSSLWEIALGELQKLHQKTRLTVGLAVLDGLHVVYLQVISAPLVMHELHESGRPLGSGSRLPASCTAAGKVLLAHLSDEERTERVGEIDFECRGQAAGKARMVFEAELEEITDRGVGINDGESAPGVVAIAVPVRGEGEVIAAVSLIARQPEITMRALLDQHTGVLLRTAQQISTAIADIK
jgi:IclR family pca regulon transcriptional regulator